MTVGVNEYIGLTISGVTYYLAKHPSVRTWFQVKDVNAVSPKMASGAIEYSDLSFWSHAAQEDFRHGFGHRRFRDVAGYHYSSGSIDTRHKDVVQLATRIVASDENLKVQARQMIDFSSNVYACFDGSDVGDELLSNTGFETAGAGGDDVFGSWTEVKSSSTIADDATAHGGTHACKITTGAASDTAHVYQDVTVTAGKHYTLDFWTRTDAGDVAGFYRIYDQTGSADIVAKTTTGVSGATYAEVGKCFTAPTGCTTVRIYLYCSTTNTDVVYFDDVSVKEGTSGIRKFTTSWAGVDDVDVIRADVYCLVQNGYAMFAGVNGGQTLYSTDGAAWAGTSDASADDFRYAVIGGGRLWFAKDADNHIHYDTTIDMSTLEGDENDPNRITVGPGDPTGTTAATPITGMAWFNGFLYVAREDGLWALSTEDNIARQVLPWGSERRSTNGQGMLVWNDRLIIPKGPALLSFTGTSISDITPPPIGEVFPYTPYGKWEALATFGPYLYVAAQEGEEGGAVASETLRPNAAGDANQLELNGSTGGSTNYTAVDESMVDYSDNVGYLWGTPETLHDLYNIDATGLGAETINKVTVRAMVAGWTDNYPNCYFNLGVKAGTTTSWSSNFVLANGTTSWTSYSNEWVLNPDDSAAWAVSDLADLQIGIKMSGYPMDWCVCAQIWLEVEYQVATPYRLLCYDGAAWHNLGSLNYGGKCLHVSPATNDLWINDKGTNYDTRYMQLQQYSFLPKGDYPTTGTHSLYLSRFDSELRNVDKCYHELVMQTENCTSARYITVYYRTSGSTWVSLGNVTQSPTQTVSLSDVTGRYIDFRLDFVTDSATETPILEGWVLRYLARPATIYGYVVSCLVADTVRGLDGKIKRDYTFEQLDDALRAARDSSVPITLITPRNQSKSVVVSSYSQAQLDYTVRTRRLEGLVVLNLVEAS